jgi:TFIIF-interacting CTD phosphatase-like protein
MKKIPEITVQNLDHLGLVAGIIDRSGNSGKNQSASRFPSRRNSKSRSRRQSNDTQWLGFSISTVIFILKIF